MNVHARAAIAIPVALLPDYATARVRRTHTATAIEIEACNCNKMRRACTTTCYSLTVTASVFARFDSSLLSRHNFGLFCIN